MTFTLDAVRNCGIPMIAAPHAVGHTFRQPSSHARVSKSKLFDVSHRSWPQDLEKMNGVGARPPARAFKHAEHSKPYAYRLPCLTTCRQHEDGKVRPRSRSSVIARCEMERKGQTPEHEKGQRCEEKKCNKSEHAHVDHRPGHVEGCDSELREWKGAKDARSCCKKKDTRHELIGVESKAGAEAESEAESEWQDEEDSHREYTPRHSGVDEKRRVSSTLSVVDKGYVIKVSKELMGLFCYIEKRKRTMIKELAQTLKQIAAVSVVITCVRGIFAPLVEVFKTTPPSWSKLLLMLVSFDSIAVCYLTIKSTEPLEQLAAITTENRRDIMESIEKEEEMILKIAVEFIRLFKRLRNIAISITVSQTAQLIFTVLRLKDPNFVVNCLKVVQTWLQAPWS